MIFFRKKKSILVLFIGIFLMFNQGVVHSKNFKFPNKIQYKITRGSNVAGNVLFSFEKIIKDKKYFICMKNFQGLGFKSNDSWQTYIDFDLILASALIIRNTKLISELAIFEDYGFFSIRKKSSKKDKIYVYQDLSGKKPLRTEIPTEHDIMDLLSSFVVISKKVFDGKAKIDEKFNLFIAKTSYLVDCLYSGSEKYNYKGKKVTVDKLTLRYYYDHSDVFDATKKSDYSDLTTFYIYKAPDGYCFPVKVEIEHDGNTFGFRANKIIN